MRSDQDAPTRRLERLSRMHEYEVAPNESDPRGWNVVNRERRRVGEVKDLIVDRERMVATYLDVYRRALVRARLAESRWTSSSRCTATCPTC